MAYLCTCARAEIPPHRASVSRKRLGQLCSNLVCGLGVINEPSTSHRWSASARAHVHTLFHKCSACCFSVTVGRIALKFGKHLGTISYSLCSSHGWGISARAHVHTALLYLTNGSADCIQIWCVGFESLPKCFPQVMGWVSLHVRTCRPRFCISGTAWPIEFNFGV